MEQEIPKDLVTEEKTTEDQEDVLMDFSSMFKGKRNAKRPVLQAKKAQQPKIVNWLLEIPAKLDITRQDLEQRKVLNQKRWQSISKANSKNQELNQINLKMIASVLSCWNFLYSSKGLGNKKAISVKGVLNQICAIDEKVIDEKIDEFYRKKYIEKICELISKITECPIQSKVAVKLQEPEKSELESSDQLNHFLNQLKAPEPKSAFIYLAYDEILCPIGYEITLMKPLDAYQKLDKISEEDRELWIINGTTGSFEPAFQIKRWKHIIDDLSAKYPEYLDIKEAKKGIQKRSEQQINATFSGNPNYILEISKKQ